MKSFLFAFTFFLVGCVAPSQIPSAEGSFWTCQHIYSNDRSVHFTTDNIQLIQILDCPEIIMNEGKCPSYVKIDSLEGNTVWLTMDEWENYACRFQEKNNETR